ncbi:hypothetical protein AVT43_gp02 [Polaribacter phage P12002L]|uniref:Biopterin-dependent aromatic amino acid hydroxylase family profile domain-containing protein n=2 Tax=Incheonvirus TaxID=2976977 RepID=A0A0F7IKJ0_9CAUD|nr:hypothetical protein AVT42_gp02 [Polaribacter phage P12002S]YP_009209662.1 hypothetical protein AVT43_gp02 [Polaribacter phage P12002L]AKG94176.1 hypothetical protein P12002L_0002 [Polaribacter phage P12002L]AKG94258.1 hypothetical protein P12002S_0002 [Polaribacter phage P12002S]
MIWVEVKYGLNSPRLHKIKKMLDGGVLRSLVDDSVCGTL